MRAGRAVALLVGLSVGTTARSAGAQTRCPAIEGGDGALAGVDADARLAFVRATMRDQASRAKTWSWAWSGIGLGLAVGQFGEMALVPAHERFQQAFEGAATLYIPGAIALFPLEVRADDATLERFLSDTDSNGEGTAPCLRLERAEELLAASAHDESLHTNWLQHTLAIVLGAGYAVLLQVAFKNVGNTILNGGGGIVIGELQILTSPTGAVSALERYRRGDIGGASAAAPKISWTFAPLDAAPGVSLVARF